MKVKKSNGEVIILIISIAIILFTTTDIIIKIIDFKFNFSLEILVDILLVFSTIFLSVKTMKITKDQLKSECYSLVNVWKIAYGGKLLWGSHVTADNEGKQSYRLIFLIKNINDMNMIKKIKINEIEVYDAKELDKQFTFKHKLGDGNDTNGYQNTEYASFISDDERINNAYRVPIIFYSDNIEKFKKYLEHEECMIKMRIELINHMNVKTNCRITFIFQKDSRREYWQVQGCNYYNDIEIEY